MCFLPKCRYHNKLIVNIKELLQKLDAFCFKYQHFLESHGNYTSNLVPLKKKFVS